MKILQKGIQYFVPRFELSTLVGVKGLTHMSNKGDEFFCHRERGAQGTGIPPENSLVDIFTGDLKAMLVNKQTSPVSYTFSRRPLNYKASKVDL